MNESASHVWRFFSAGGFDQVKLETAADLRHLGGLDQKLWVALACPVTGLEFDAQTLALIDTDKDGRVRAPELLAAVAWSCRMLKDPASMVRRPGSLPLAQINDGDAEGAVLLASARTILTSLGKSGSQEISPEDLANKEAILTNTRFNGDGVVTPEAADAPAVQSVIADIIATCGAVADRSGKPGVNRAKVDQFFTATAAYVAWADAGAASEVSFLGPATAGAYGAWKAVSAKIDDFFARVQLAAFDPRALGALNRDEKDFAALGAGSLSAAAAEASGFPIAAVAAGRPLSLAEGINPAWAERMAAFRALAVEPALGSLERLDESQWRGLSARFVPYAKWLAAKAGLEVEALGLERVRAAGSAENKAAIDALLARDLAEEASVNAIAAVDKLVRYHRDLHLLCTNFVNFHGLYSGAAPAIFQIGTLYLDQRSCDLCLAVEDGGRHAALAGMSGAYLAYCDCVRKATGEKMQIVAAFTNGDGDNLLVGRNGIFYDRRGRDFDATIVKVVENPISLRQAFWAPYKKLARVVEEQVAKRIAAADVAAQDQLARAASATAAGPPAAPKKLDIGVVAAMGVALGSISGVLASVFTKLIDLAPAQMVLAVIGAVAAVSGPSMALTFLKLRKRNLGPLLDANGWAMNTRARINVPFGAALTKVAALPANAKRDLFDPYAEKSRPWRLYLTIAVAGYLGFKWFEGDFDIRLPKALKSPEVFGTWAPQYPHPAATGTNAPPAPAK